MKPANASPSHPKPVSDSASQSAVSKPEASAAAQNVAGKNANVGDVSKAPAVQEKKVLEEKKEAKKLTLGQKIKKEVQHYWDGTKLLATEVRISTRLVLKMAAGYELSRRESRQVSLIIFLC